jgi:septal ring factor EnvC (AmiA/AmiB activator)
MHVTMVKEAWTDERLDDLAKGVGEVRAEVRETRKEVAHVREELGELRAELKSLQKTMEARFDAQQKYMDARFDAIDARLDDALRTMQIGFGLTGVVLAALIGLIATQL